MVADPFLVPQYLNIHVYLNLGLWISDMLHLSKQRLSTIKVEFELELVSVLFIQVVYRFISVVTEGE